MIDIIWFHITLLLFSRLQNTPAPQMNLYMSHHGTCTHLYTGGQFYAIILYAQLLHTRHCWCRHFRILAGTPILLRHCALFQYRAPRFSPCLHRDTPTQSSKRHGAALIDWWCIKHHHIRTLLMVVKSASRLLKYVIIYYTILYLRSLFMILRSRHKSWWI